MSALRDVWSLGAAMTWRSWRQLRWRLLFHPLGYAALIVAFWMIVFYVPGILNDLTLRALARGAELRFGSVPGRAGLAMAMILLQGPYLVALFSAMAASSIARSAVGSEVASGGIELLIATRHRPRRIFLAMLVHSLFLSILSWIAIATGMIGAVAALLALHGAYVHLPASSLALVLVMPLPMVLWATLVSLWLGLERPRFSGATIGVSRLLVVQPPLILILLVNFRPDLDPVGVAAGAFTVGLLACALVALIAGRRFRTEALLAH